MTAQITRRQFLKAAGLGAVAWAVNPAFAEVTEGGHPMIVKPTPQQLAWHEDELSMFIHFGTNTFTNREWGEGTEDPRVFNPSDLDAGQWARIAKAAGFKLMIATAKHHDGLCLWPSRYTEHSIKASPWKSGNGD
ncbi:MAG: alpha-L-fucosidase, partial [Armatimonadetes bacterium]|nr:alpha-L-fucosidase [Armatimonadota bacterium]